MKPGTASANDTVSAVHARTNRLRWWWQYRMGVTGAAALALLALALLLAAWLRPGIDAARRELAREQVARQETLARRPAAPAVPGPADAREQMHPVIPLLRQRGKSVARLLDLAAGSGVMFERGEYAAEDHEPGLSRLRITLPVAGTYAQIRATIARLLNGMPNATLDAIDIERPNADARALEATLRLSLYFRKDTP